MLSNSRLASLSMNYSSISTNLSLSPSTPDLNFLELVIIERALKSSTNPADISNFLKQPSLITNK